MEVKKIFFILMVIVLAISFVSKDGFCVDDYQQREAATDQQCSLTCHSCFSAVIPVQGTFFSIVENTTPDTIQVVSYQNPIITRLKRPPIQIS